MAGAGTTKRIRVELSSAGGNSAAARLQHRRIPGLRCNSQLVLSVLLPALLAAGCATEPRPISERAGVQSAGAHTYHFARIALEEDLTPATFSFQKAQGKRGSAKEAIVNSAELGLSGPGAAIIETGYVLSGACTPDAADSDPRFYAAVAVIAGGAAGLGAALAGPVVGAKELILSVKKVSPAELAERETALTEALNEEAGQQPFQAALAAAGSWNIPGGFVRVEKTGSTGTTASAQPEAVLQAGVDDLRLERAGKGEGSYFLRIKTHARLLRATDGAVCYEGIAEYRSGKALFLDWTMHGAIQSVADTGYHALADYYLARLPIGPKNGN